MNSQLKDAIEIVRKHRGSPAYISQEANLIVDENENLVTLLKKYLSFPSLDGNIQRQQIRKQLENYIS
jgi:hypothetical protein